MHMRKWSEKKANAVAQNRNDRNSNGQYLPQTALPVHRSDANAENCLLHPIYNPLTGGLWSAMQTCEAATRKSLQTFPKPSSQIKSRPVCLALQILKIFFLVYGCVMDGSVYLFFFIYTAHSGYPGVFESFHFAVCISSCCHLIRHTNVSHCPGSPRNHVLLHPEVLPSRIKVRA